MLKLGMPVSNYFCNVGLYFLILNARGTAPRRRSAVRTGENWCLTIAGHVGPPIGFRTLSNLCLASLRCYPANPFFLAMSCISEIPPEVIRPLHHVAADMVGHAGKKIMSPYYEAICTPPPPMTHTSEGIRSLVPPTPNGRSTPRAARTKTKQQQQYYDVRNATREKKNLLGQPYSGPDCVYSCHPHSHT